jgi:hypothetical protein
MLMKLSWREGVWSFGVFGAVLFALTTVDPRVQDKLADLIGHGSVSSVGPWTHRAGELGDALWAAARYQSLENAPLLVFATVGTVLTIFMFKS